MVLGISNLPRGDVGEGWDGVRNYQASKFHEGNGFRRSCVFSIIPAKSREIVGIVEVCELYHPDPTDPKGRFGMVSVKAKEALANPVTLARVKDEPRLSELLLIRQSRLSVMPIPAEAWSLIFGYVEQ